MTKNYVIKKGVSQNDYVLWCDTNNKGSMSCYKVMRGTKKECEAEKKKLKKRGKSKNMYFKYKIKYDNKELEIYASTDIEEILNKLNIKYVRNMLEAYEPLQKEIWKENFQLKNEVKGLYKIIDDNLQKCEICGEYFNPDDLQDTTEMINGGCGYCCEQCIEDGGMSYL